MQKLGYVLTALILYMLGCETGPDNIARVGSLDISDNEFRSALTSRYPHKETFKDLDLAKKEEILDNLIRRKLKLNAAYEQELQKNNRIVDQVKEYEEKLIIGRYHEKVVIDVLVPTEEVEKFIRNQRYEVNASHILISFRDVNPRVERTMEEAENLAREVYQKLMAGADFSDMARQYSDDPTAGTNGGNLSYFTWGTMVPEFQETAWELRVGGISEPVKTRFGYHIIRIEDKREQDGYRAPEDEEEIFYIKRRLFMSHGDSGRIVWEKHIDKLKDRYDYEIEKQNILAIATTITRKIYEGVTAIEAFGDSQLNMVLASWRGGNITVEDLFAGDQDRLNRLLVRYKQAQFVEEDVESRGVRRLLISDAKARGIDEDPYIRKPVHDFLETQLLQAVEKHEVSDKSEATPEETKAFYDSNPDKFLKPAEIELWEIFVDEEILAKDLAIRVKNGENFEKLANRYSQDKRYQPKNGYLGFLSSGARGIITREAFSLGPHGKIGGPLKYRNGWVVFKTGQKHEAVIRPFNEVKNRASSLLRQSRLNERRVSWEDSLRNAYPVSIDTVKLREI